jgi:hypothetical protein
MPFKNSAQIKACFAQRARDLASGIKPRWDCYKWLKETPSRIKHKKSSKRRSRKSRKLSKRKSSKRKSRKSRKSSKRKSSKRKSSKRKCHCK